MFINDDFLPASCCCRSGQRYAFARLFVRPPIIGSPVYHVGMGGACEWRMAYFGVWSRKATSVRRICADCASRQWIRTRPVGCPGWNQQSRLFSRNLKMTPTIKRDQLLTPRYNLAPWLILANMLCLTLKTSVQLSKYISEKQCNHCHCSGRCAI